MAEEKATIPRSLAVGAGLGLQWFVFACLVVWWGWSSLTFEDTATVTVVLITFTLYVVGLPALIRPKYRSVKAVISLFIGGVIVAFPLVILAVIVFFFTQMDFTNHR